MTTLQVTKVDDLAAFPGIRLLGPEDGEPIEPGLTLTDSATGRVWTVLSVEFPTPLARRNGWTTVLLRRTGEPAPAVGTMLSNESGTTANSSTSH